MNDKILEKNDVFEITAKTALSVIPVGGTLITCVWDSIKANCAQKRLDEWKKLMEDRLTTVEITLNEASNNERFTTAMMKATDSAIKTMENEKRKYLADAVLNSLTCSIDESIMMMYFDLIDRYTLWHIKVLDFFSNPTKFREVSASKFFMGSPIEPLTLVYPELKGNEEFIDKIVIDLYVDKLMDTENINSIMTSQGMIAPRTTKMGNQFISFITSN